MSEFYDEMAATALELITEYGQSATLTDTIPGAYDPVSGTSTGDQSLSQQAQAILLDYTTQEAGLMLAAGSQIIQGDKKILIAAKGLAWPPTTATRVLAGGHSWTIVNIRSANPAGTPLTYELHGRR